MIGAVFVLTGWMGLAPTQQAMAHSNVFESVEPVGMAAASDGGFSCKLTRVNVLTGAFAELDLWVAEFKVLPYVELRFNRRK